jgi:hypothetical protein
MKQFTIITMFLFCQATFAAGISPARKNAIDATGANNISSRLLEGVFHQASNSNPMDCSWFGIFDERSQVLSLDAVDQYNGEFACSRPQDSSYRMNCQKDENSGLITCGQSCSQQYGCLVRATIVDNKTIRVSGVDKNDSLGILTWRAKESPQPKKYPSAYKWNWSWIPGVSSGNCKIPPYDSVIDCDKIPLKLVQDTCKKAQPLAENAALGFCQNRTGSQCKIQSGKSQLLINQISDEASLLLETGCKWTSVAVPL